MWTIEMFRLPHLRGEEVGGLRAILLFADRGLIPEVDEAFALAFRVREWPSVQWLVRFRLLLAVAGRNKET